MKNKGITLISLIVTIIVLLILAGVTISMLTGENGILSRAESAKEQTVVGEEKEQISLAWNAVKTDELGGTVTATELQEELDGKAIVTEEDGKLTVTVIKTGNVYSITEDGELKEVTKTEESEKPQEPIEDDDIANEWEYTLSDLTITLTKYIGTSSEVTVKDIYEIDGVIYNTLMQKTSYDSTTKVYIGPFATNTLITDVIFEDGVEYEENDALSAFYKCSSLKTVSNLPSSITNMEGTFARCESLIIAPTLPDGVTNLTGTFSGCTSLTVAPTIPDSVTNMTCTFQGTSLVTAPEIPNSVTNMTATFSGCKSLTTAPTIPSNVTNMGNTFSNCIKLAIPPDMSKATSVTNMDSTFWYCTSLTTAPTIPSNVTNMGSTFSNCINLTGTLKIQSSNVVSAGNIVSGTYGFVNPSETSKFVTIVTPGSSTTTYQEIYNTNSLYIGTYFYLQ